MLKVTIQIEGLPELVKKMNNPALAREPVKEMLETAGKLAQETATTAISGGTGIAERSIGYKSYSKGMSLKVYTMIKKPRAMSIELGRKPGDKVPFPGLARWLGQKLPQNEEAFVETLRLQRAISERGAKGKFYMKATHEILDKEMPKLQDKAFKRIEELFYK